MKKINFKKNKRENLQFSEEAKPIVIIIVLHSICVHLNYEDNKQSIHLDTLSL